VRNSSLTAFRSAVDKAKSKSDNPRSDIRLENLRFLYLLRRRHLICIAIEKWHAIVDNLSERARSHANVIGIERITVELTRKELRLLHIGRNRAI